MTLRAQGSENSRAFWEELSWMGSHEPDDLNNLWVRKELSISADDANTLLAIGQEYQAAVYAIDQPLRRTLLALRMAAMAAGESSAASEQGLAEERQHKTDTVAEDSMQGIRARLGDAVFQRIKNLIAEHKEGTFFIPEGKALPRL